MPTTRAKAVTSRNLMSTNEKDKKIQVHSMSNINTEIEQQLRNEHVDIIHFVDISMLDIKQNRGLPFAILIGIAINPHFLEMVCNTPNYTHTIDDEYAQTESRVR